MFRSETPRGSYTEINGAPVTSSDFVDFGVINDTTYFYVVTAVDFSGNESFYSFEVSATPQAPIDVTPPEAPTGLTADGQDGLVS